MQASDDGRLGDLDLACFRLGAVCRGVDADAFGQVRQRHREVLRLGVPFEATRILNARFIRPVQPNLFAVILRGDHGTRLVQLDLDQHVAPFGDDSIAVDDQ